MLISFLKFSLISFSFHDDQKEYTCKKKMEANNPLLLKKKKTYGHEDAIQFNKRLKCAPITKVLPRS